MNTIKSILASSLLAGIPLLFAMHSGELLRQAVPARDERAVATAAGTLPVAKTTTFKVRIENTASPDGQLASDGSRWPFALSPGLWVVHEKKAPLFKTGKKDAGKGLEAQAEDGNPEPLLASVRARKDVTASGVFNTPVGASEPGPIVPGGAYEFTFEAAPGARLSLAAMFGQSNDLFYAPDDKGIALFNGDQPIRGNLTPRLILWDAGTEVNQEPGIGPDQAPRQQAPNTGPAEDEPIQVVKDGFTYPTTTDVLRITITPVQPL